MCNEVTEKILIPGFLFSRSPFLVLVTSNTTFYEGHEHYTKKNFPSKAYRYLQFKLSSYNYERCYNEFKK